jgi:uncharacterized protein
MESDSSCNRREVLGALAGASLAALPAAAAASEHSDMIYRTFGRTGIRVSAIGLGGAHVGSPADENDGIRIVRSGGRPRDHLYGQLLGLSSTGRAKSGDGQAALRDGYREKVFLMTKFDGRTKAFGGASDR